MFSSCHTFTSEYRLKRAGIFLVILVCFGSTCASASPFLLTFGGTIDYSTTSAVPVGTPYFGSLRYDTTDAVLLSISPTSAVYSFGPSDSLTLSTGPYTFSISGNSPDGFQNQLQVVYQQTFDGEVADVFFAGDYSETGISSNLPGLTPTFLGFQIAGPPGLLTADGLPESFDFSKVDPVGYGIAATQVGVSFADGELFSGDFNSLEIQAVPEPATGVLLSSIVLGLILRRKRVSRTCDTPRVTHHGV
ncbi:MAG TPA: PEP-CTERM sorting domain-containing protein [Bryobacteraceae bacterium]|nr:PEP-CTERM sorting domain-containing protein [Bryobacteraceae bacterium]